MNKYDIAKRSGAIRSDTEYKRLYNAGLIDDKYVDQKLTTYGRLNSKIKIKTKL